MGGKDANSHSREDRPWVAPWLSEAILRQPTSFLRHLPLMIVIKRISVNRKASSFIRIFHSPTHKKIVVFPLSTYKKIVVVGLCAWWAFIGFAGGFWAEGFAGVSDESSGRRFRV
jgi:hypothetical protein